MILEARDAYLTPPCRIVGTTAADMGPSRTWTWKSAAAGSSYLSGRGIVVEIYVNGQSGADWYTRGMKTSVFYSRTVNWDGSYVVSNYS